MACESYELRNYIW